MTAFPRYSLFLPLVFSAFIAAAQSKTDIEKLAIAPKKTVELPLDYAISLPGVLQWDHDYHLYDHFMTRTVSKTQIGLSFKKDSVETLWCAGSARPHAQLDTSTIITDPKQLIGTWRSVSNRTINFQDSAIWSTREYLRNNTLIKQQNGDDVFLQITDKQLRLYAKPEGKENFKREGSGRYALESGRYLMLYKLVKGGASISQVGIDKEGRLVMQAAIVEERKIRGSYIVYEAIISQSVFERVNDLP